MKNTVLCGVLLIGLALAGCSPDLGDFKYLAKHPKVKATILSSKVEPASSEYGSPTLKVSGVAQENEPFPVKRYFLTIGYQASFGGENTYDGRIVVEMVEGKGSFEGNIYLSDLLAGADKKPVVFQLKEAAWYPRTIADVEFVEQKK